MSGSRGSAWDRLSKHMRTTAMGCAGCGQRFPPSEYQVDHVIPLKAGAPLLGGKLQVLCRPCHASKTARKPARGTRKQPFRG